MTRPSSNGHHVQHGLYGDSAQPQSNGFSGGQGTEPPNRKIYNHKSNNPKNHTDCVRGQMTINGHATPMPPPQRRLLILENAKEFSDRLYAQPCRLDLLMCAIWFRKMPYKEKPSEQDLKALIDKFDEIVLNTIPDRLNPIMLAQWSCLLTKCEMSENNLKNLLQLTTKLIEQLKNWKFQQIAQVLYNLRNLLNSADSDALMFALSQEIETAELLDSQAIGNGLYGLQKMTSSDATDAVLSSLARHIWLSKQPLFPGHIAMALYGLKI